MAIQLRPQMLNTHAGVQQQLSTLVRDQPVGEAERMSTFIPVESRPDLPPNMRMHTRLDYLNEYFGYWKYGKVTKVLGVALLILGILSLNAFAPGALLMIAVSARLLDLAWWYNFIVFEFGKSRSLVYLD